MNQPSGTADSPARAPAGDHAEFIQQLDAVLDELSILAQSATNRSDFYPLLLARLVVASRAAAAAVWLPGPDRDFVPAYAAELQAHQASASAAAIVAEREQLRAFAGQDQLRCTLTSATGGWVTALQVRVAGQVRGLLTVYRSAAETAATSEGLAPLWTALVEIIVDFESSNLLRAIESGHATHRDLADLLLELHASRGTRELAYVLANDGRTYLGCDRISVFRVGGSVRHVATSGVARADRRSRYARHLGRLTSYLAKRGRSFAYPLGLAELPRRWQREASEFSHEHGVNAWYFVVWKSPPAAWARARVNGAYTLEFFQSVEAGHVLPRLAPLEPHLAVAWQSRIQNERNPLRGLGGFLGAVWMGLGLDRWPRAALACVALCALVFTLLTVQREFRIEVQGKLVPTAQPHVWAPLDGIVRRVAVQHGDQVVAGQLLLELESPELELELQKVQGRLRSAQLRREGYRLSLQQAEKLRREPDADQVKLSAEIAEADAEIESLAGEQQFLQGLQAQQQITSPQAGEVITWNVAELLANRPVRQGESLLVLGDTAGPWQIEFAVPDRVMKYIGEAQRAQGAHLVIDCLAANDPQHPFTAEIAEVAPVALPGAGVDPEIKVVAAVERAALPTLRVGLSVTGRVRCGQRSLWYIGTYEVVDAIRRRFMW